MSSLPKDRLSPGHLSIRTSDASAHIEFFAGKLISRFKALVDFQHLAILTDKFRSVELRVCSGQRPAEIMSPIIQPNPYCGTRDFIRGQHNAGRRVEISAVHC